MQFNIRKNWTEEETMSVCVLTHYAYSRKKGYCVSFNATENTWDPHSISEDNEMYVIAYFALLSKRFRRLGKKGTADEEKKCQYEGKLNI